MRRAIILLGAASLLAVGCKATIPSDTFACMSDSECPEGFSCVGGFCNEMGGGVDAGEDVDAGPGMDAGDMDAGPGTDGGDDAGPPPADAGDTESTMAECSDSLDNDADGDTDCEDTSCCGSGACTPGLLACDCPPVAMRMVETVSGPISPGTEWTCDKLYRLQGVVTVPNGDLIVHPGTIVLAEADAALIVERGARLLAVGTEDRPIHFTSANPRGMREPGDWRGVFLLGQAPINDVNVPATLFGFTPSFLYGGTDTASDCGQLEYVNLTFGGASGGVDLALIGCGTDTRVSYVHTSYSLDTNFYVGGGTVRLHHISSWSSRDEGFLYSEGWVGSAQFVFVGAAEGAALRGRTSFVDSDRTPFSTPQIWNATLAGSTTSDVGVDLLSGSGIHMGNSIIFGIPDPRPCFSVDASAEPRIPTDLDIRHSILWDCGGTQGFDSGRESNEFRMTSLYANRFVDPGLDLVAPLPGSAATMGSTTPPTPLMSVPYLGAFEPAPAGSPDWTDPWGDYAAN